MVPPGYPILCALGYPPRVPFSPLGPHLPQVGLTHAPALPPRL
jgi:hypothetical protein